MNATYIKARSILVITMKKLMEIIKRILDWFEGTGDELDFMTLKAHRPSE